MTRLDIIDRLNAIASSRGDAEGAHSMEDSFHQDVMRAIVAGELDGITPEQACELALTSLDIEFSRWCA